MNIKSVAGDVISGLKGEPILLVVLLLNVILVGGLGYFLIKFGEANAERMQLILKSCLPN
jgi:hypothetical protein